MSARLAALLLTLLLAATALAGSSAPCDAPGLPADLLALMPANPHVVVVCESYRELEVQWDRLREAIPAMEEDEGMPRLDDTLSENMPGLFDLLDRGGPAAFAVVVHPIMLQKSPSFYLVLPVDGAPTDAEIQAHLNAQTWHRSGEYLGVSSDPDYAPVPWSAEAAATLMDGAVAGTLDLESLIVDNRGMIEMALGGMTMQLSVQQPGQEGPPPMSAEEAAELAAASRAIVDSMDRIDLAWDGDAETLVLRSAMDVLPGSPLDAGDHPPLADALALTRRLPADADFWWVSALDMEPFAEILEPLQRLNMLQSLQNLPAEGRQDVMDWYASFYGMESMSYECAAMALSHDAEGFTAYSVTRCEDPEEFVDGFRQLFAPPMPQNEWMIARELPETTVDGRRVLGWHLDFDAITAELEADGDEDAQAALRLFALLPDELRLSFHDGAAWFAADTDSAALDALFAAEGRLDKVAGQAARQAGPNCRQLYGGDLRFVFESLASMMPEMADHPALPPAPIAGHVAIDGVRTYSELRIGHEGLAGFLHGVAVLEALDED